MSDIPALTFVTAPAAPTSFNVLAFGPVGSGKSTAAATLAAFGPVLWLNLEGAGALAYARKTAGDKILEVRLNVAEVKKPTDKDGLDPTATLREFVRYAKTEQPPTVVIDTIGKLRDALAAQYVQPGHRQVRDQWGEVAKILRAALVVLRDLPCNLVLLAHQDVDGEGEDRLIRPKIGGALTEDIPGEMDVVTYTTAVVVQDDPEDPKSKRRVYYGQLVDGNGRQGLKDRSGGLGLYRELDLAEWLPVYCDALRSSDSDADLPWVEEEEPPADVGIGPDDPGGQFDLDDAQAEAA
jgi:hypothetical protein